MATILAKKTTGTTLSQSGLLTNPLFGQTGSVGDAAGVDVVIDTAGKYRSGNYRVAGIAHVQMSLDGVSYGAEAAELIVPGPITDAATRIWLKIGSTVAVAPALVLLQTGIIDATGSGGTVVCSGGVSLSAAAGFVVAGTAVCVSVASGSATITSDPVTNFAVSSVSGTTVNLSWTAFGGADHYQIEWGTDGVTYGNTIDSVSGTSYAHTGRSADTTYYYRIKAHNAAHATLTAGYGNLPYAAVQKLILVASSRTLRGENATWATARAGSGTNSVISTDASEESANAQLDTGVYYIAREYSDYTTSGGVIPAAATIDEGWLRLTHTYVGFSSTGSAICKGTYSGSPPAASDFANVTLTDLGGPTSNPAVNTPTDYAITSPNANIEKNGTARLVVLDRQKDFANVAPATISGNNLGGKGNATSDRRPQLKVSFRG